ncbi:MAG: hypothetical protein BWY82_00541 [Verrucomicrobia bacterium ADurb.Bin474]|nr:MAG: hypothetical protein BWY82_00541 [Verrucomicrobia bacterium ADurb.Bin474]
MVGDQGIHRERKLSHHDICSRLKQCLSEKLNDFVGPVSNNEMVPRQSMYGGQLAGEIPCAPVRIEMNMRGFPDDGLYCFRRWTQRILIGCELHDT